MKIVTLWNSVGKKSISKIKFPAVTVCAQDDGKWSALISALDHYDTEGQVFDLAEKLANPPRGRPIQVMLDYKTVWDEVQGRANAYAEQKVLDGDIKKLEPKHFQIKLASQPIQDEQELMALIM